MFSKCLRLNTKNGMGTKRKVESTGWCLRPLLKAKNRTIEVARRQICTRYIRGMVSYLVKVPNNSITTQGKKRMCSFSCAKRSAYRNPASARVVQSSTHQQKRRSPQTGAHRRPQHRKAGE